MDSWVLRAPVGGAAGYAADRSYGVLLDRELLKPRSRSRERSACDPFGLPHLPRGLTLRVHRIEGLLVLERVHARPEPVVAIGEQLPFHDQAMEGFLDELLAVLDVAEDVLLEGEVTAVDQDTGVGDVADAGHDAVRLQRHDMKCLIRLDA